MVDPTTRWEQPNTSHGLALRGQLVGVPAGLTPHESPTTPGVRWVSQATAREHENTARKRKFILSARLE